MPPKHQNTKSHQKEFKAVPLELDEIGKKIVHAAFLVHYGISPGLLKKVYEICFCHELINSPYACLIFYYQITKTLKFTKIFVIILN